MNLKEGEWIILRHSQPFFEEPHQVEGTVVSIKPSKRNLADKLARRNPVNVMVETEMLGKVRIKRVTPGNLSLVIDPHTL